MIPGRLALATHPESDGATPAAKQYVRYGASPRGAQAMLLSAKVRALCDGRANVAYEDIRAAAPAALRHRLVLNFEGQAQGANPDDIVADVLEHVGETPRE